MDNTKNVRSGTIACLWAALMSLLTIFGWLGKAYTSVGSNTKIKFGDILGSSFIDNTLCFFLIAGVICAGIALYKAIDGLLNKKNNCILITFLLAVNIITFFIAVAGNDDSIEMSNTFIIMSTLYWLCFLLALCGAIGSYTKPNDSVQKNVTNYSQKLEELNQLLENGTITKDEWTALRKNILN